MPTSPRSSLPLPLIRDARDDDADQLIALIGGVFAEYPGCILDVDGEIPELRAIATAFRDQGGRFWVAEDAARVVACVGYKPKLSGVAPPEGRVGGAAPSWAAGPAGGVGGAAPSWAAGPAGPFTGPAVPVELCKLYVAREGRRRGLGSALCGLVEKEARARNAAYVELWSDTRFLDAHRLYEGRGYVRGPEIRPLHDRSNSLEYHFRLDLADRGAGG